MLQKLTIQGNWIIQMQSNQSIVNNAYYKFYLLEQPSMRSGGPRKRENSTKFLVTETLGRNSKQWKVETEISIYALHVSLVKAE